MHRDREQARRPPPQARARAARSGGSVQRRYARAATCCTSGGQPWADAQSNRGLPCHTRRTPQSESLDGRIANLAERQHGVVARRQLLEIGVGGGAIDHRIKLGRLHVVHRGVYAVGHRILTIRGRWMGAVIASGPGAVLSHRGRSRALEIRTPLRRGSDCAVATRHSARHRSPPASVLPPDEVTTVQGIPVTTVPRTLLDLAAVLPERQFETGRERSRDSPAHRPALACRSGRASPAPQRHPRRRGGSLEVLRAGTTVMRSELEARFRELLRARGLPPAELNASVLVNGRWVECDCVWPAARLIVELDGRAVHDTAAAFERDRERDRMLHASGWRVVRVTWRQLHGDPDVVAADLRKLLVRVRRHRDRPPLPHPARPRRRRDRPRGQRRDGPPGRERRIEIVCATPHIRSDHDVHADELEGRIEAVNAELERQGIAVRVAPGGEVADEALDEVADDKLRLVSLGADGRLAPDRAPPRPDHRRPDRDVDRLADARLPLRDRPPRAPRRAPTSASGSRRSSSAAR